jgi:hypothetical protein
MISKRVTIYFLLLFVVNAKNTYEYDLDDDKIEEKKEELIKSSLLLQLSSSLNLTIHHILIVTIGLLIAVSVIGSLMLSIVSNILISMIRIKSL